MFLAIRLLQYFPSITFGYPFAEIFPWSIIYGLPKIKKTIFSEIFILFFLILCSALYVIFTEPYKSLEAIRSSLAYINGLLPFVYIGLNKSTENTKLARASVLAFLIIFVVSMIQVFGIGMLYDPLFKFFVPRAYGESLTEYGGRGVTALSSEPSRAAIDFIFITLTYVGTQCVRRSEKAVLILIMCIIVIFIIKSADGMALFFLTCMAFVGFFRAILLAAVASVLILVSSIYFGTESRLVYLINDVIRFNSALEVFDYAVNVSGFRIPTIIASLNSLPENLFGFGVGNWQTSSVNLLVNLGIQPEKLDYFVENGASNFIPVRPTSLIANIAADLGLLGVILFLIPFAKIILHCKDVRPHVFLYLAYSTILGSVGDPVPALFLTLCVSNHFTHRAFVS